MRRILLPIGVGIGLGIFAAAFLGYFVSSPGRDITDRIDGLGRPLVPGPWVVRLILLSHEEWAGWFWFFADFLWFWAGLGIAFFLVKHSSAVDEEAKSPKPLAIILGLIVVLGTAYATQRMVKTGISFGLEVTAVDLAPMANLGLAPNGSLPLMDHEHWSHLSEREQDVYTQSLLETWSFVLYGMTNPKKPSSDFADFTVCAEQEGATRFRTFAVNNIYALGEMEKPPVSVLFHNSGLICRNYTGKGDKSHRPVRLLQQDDWNKFNDKFKRLYLLGYVDMAYFLEERFLTAMAKEKPTDDQDMSRFLNHKKNNLEVLKKCIGQNGIEGLFDTLSKQSIEWQHPLPWSVATALGTECFRRR